MSRALGIPFDIIILSWYNQSHRFTEKKYNMAKNRNENDPYTLLIRLTISLICIYTSH